jgi:selenide,water dikinase
LSQPALTQVLRQLPKYRNANVLVNSNTLDDAGIYRLDRNRALVQTVDFFTPIVDDPFAYGQIAAANALSDVFAMGGRPLTALNIMGFPTDTVSAKTVAAILRGGGEKAREADCAMIGGHTIRNPEPIYGLAVTGVIDIRCLMTNANARAGDLLVLTKPLGTGIATTAIKRGIASRRLAKQVISLMSTINSIGAQLAESKLVRAAVDVTGFGLIGHLANICRASSLSARIDFKSVPVISREILDLIRAACVPGGTRDNFAAAEPLAHWGNLDSAERLLLTDAQTSGGLLLCVKPGRLNRVLQLLKKSRAPSAAVIGELRRSRGHPLICTTN